MTTKKPPRDKSSGSLGTSGARTPTSTFADRSGLEIVSAHPLGSDDELWKAVKTKL